MCLSLGRPDESPAELDRVYDALMAQVIREIPLLFEDVEPADELVYVDPLTLEAVAV